ncbi:MAG: phage holin family protein [Chitinophagaceae bacterium]|nr:MAG: phage holin family protein [Chitinophagaceae bacterium]
MAEIKEKAEELIEHATDYAETYYKLSMLKLTEKTSAAGSGMIAAIILAVLAFFVLLFIGMGLSWWIGGMLENMIAGYFIVAGIYLLLILCIVLMRKSVIDPFFRNFIVKKIYE